jgi:23S rRNA (pseudouridine1915-N3)-methyltransferase
MQISLIAVGKTQAPWIKDGLSLYVDRLKHYTKFQWVEVPDAKPRPGKPDPTQVKRDEALLLEKHLQAADHIILLDERGTAYDSIAFSQHIARLQNRGLKHVAFVIGGPYGFDARIESMSHAKWSMGPLTFSHQMIRVFAAEQIYRAHTLLKGEPYHHA